MRKIVGFCALMAAMFVSPVMGAATNSFIVPFDAIVTLTPEAGSAPSVTEFGLGTSQANLTPLFTGLPGNLNQFAPVDIGFYAAGTPIDMYMKTTFGITDFAFSSDTVTAASVTAFTDKDNSLQLGGSVYQQINSTTYLAHLDDARSHDFDDDDNDVLMQISLTPVPEPASLVVMGVGGVLVLMRRRS